MTPTDQRYEQMAMEAIARIFERYDSGEQIGRDVVSKIMQIEFTSLLSQVAAEEREGCAVIAETKFYDPSHGRPSAHQAVGMSIAKAIRNKGEGV